MNHLKTKKEIQEHVKKVTAPYKYPRIIEFVDELPKTISGKIKRAEIRKRDEMRYKKNNKRNYDFGDREWVYN